jgi:hypothetical protein
LSWTSTIACWAAVGLPAFGREPISDVNHALPVSVRAAS